MGTARVSRVSEKIHGQVFVYRIITEKLLPTSRMAVKDVANQTFTARMSIWKASDDIETVEFGREVFLVNRELAAQPQEAEEPVKEIGTKHGVDNYRLYRVK